MQTIRSTALLLLAAATACGGPHQLQEVTNGDLLQAAWGRPRFERSWRRTEMPVEIDPVLLGSDGSRDWNPLRSVAYHGLTCEVGPRHFYFVTRPDRSGVRYELAWLEIGTGRPLQTIVPAVEPPPGRMKLWFGVEVTAGGLVVLLPVAQRIVELRARVTDQGLSFAEPQTLATVAGLIQRVQLVPTDDRLHALWVAGGDAGSSVVYCSTPLDERNWTRPRELVDTANGSACLAAGDRDLCVAWCDTRYRWRPSAFAGYRNDGKVFVTISRDGGRTFTPPATLHGPQDQGANADGVVVAFGAGGLAFGLRLDEQAPGGGIARWRQVAVDSGLERMHIGGLIEGRYDGCW